MATRLRRDLTCLVQVAASLAVGVAAAQALTSAAPADARTPLTVTGGPATARATRVPFVLTGSVRGLGPGVRSTFGVRVVNPADVPYRLLTLRAQAVGDARCTVVFSRYTAGPGAPVYTVPARRSIVVPLGVTMTDLPRSQDVCKGATFRVALAGTAAGAA